MNNYKIYRDIKTTVNVYHIPELFLSILSDLKNTELPGVVAYIPNYVGSPFESRLRDLLPIVISLCLSFILLCMV